MTSEERVYVWTKRLLQRDDWTVLAGDPPRGSDGLRLEIKPPGGTQSRTKNADAMLNDLVAYRSDHLLLVECKDSASRTDADVAKLRRLTGERPWRTALADALSERSLLSREGIPSGTAIRSGACLVPCIAYPGTPRGVDGVVEVGYGPDGDPAIRIDESLPAAARAAVASIR